MLNTFCVHISEMSVCLLCDFYVKLVPIQEKKITHMIYRLLLYSLQITEQHQKKKKKKNSCRTE